MTDKCRTDDPDFHYDEPVNHWAEIEDQEWLAEQRYDEDKNA